jgi:hypothetical protein
MFAGTRSRRDLDRTQRRAAANRRIGHEMAWLYFWARPLGIMAVLIALTAGGWFLWTRVDHADIAAAAGSLGIALLMAYGAWLMATGSAYQRSIRAARGARRGSAMHLLGFAGALLVAAAIALWSQA